VAPLKDTRGISGIQFVTDDKGRKVSVQIDIKKYGSVIDAEIDKAQAKGPRHHGCEYATVFSKQWT
jgi:hypothetical protein